MKRGPIRLVFALLALLVPALVAAGCGGDDEGGDGTTSAAALTADQWRTQADAICEDIDGRLEALGEPASPDDIGPFFEKGLPIANEGLDRLKALAPPAELKDIHDKAVELQEKQIALLQQVSDRIKGGESGIAVVGELEAELDRTDDELDGLAKEAGLKVCGDDNDSGSTGTDTTDTSTDATPPTISVPTTGDADIDKYLGDVRTASQALVDFGGALQSISNPSALEGQIPSLRGKLGEFDQAISSMSSYTLDNAQIEGQRSRLAAKGPEVSDVLRKFLTAAQEAVADQSQEKIAALTAILPEVASTLQEFGQAASG